MPRFGQNIWRDSRGGVRKFAGYGLSCVVLLAVGSAIFMAAAPKSATGGERGSASLCDFVWVGP